MSADREIFEHWAFEHYAEVIRDDEGYAAAAVHHAWEGWQARDSVHLFKWSFDKPACSGWYWRRRNGSVSVVDIRYLLAGPKVRAAPDPLYEWALEHDDGSEWAGPIPAPRPV